ncbi:hypothetical protein D3D01_14765 [Haloarcula sp. Atlit-7R]|nr:hypothetical protein DVK01_13615 [Haloarcula sp. Atlit-120R]RLM44128.1 hypothetical protein DVK00_13810 [Haloarcula sp. Atlit-47R]RLM94954.1 hypothetical protein D3D01_14765 [Haloarcula sp. Atlit-7R]
MEVSGNTTTTELIIQNKSTRVLVGGSPTYRCDYCGQVISEQMRYRGLTIRDSGGEITEHFFCEEECMTSQYPNI